MQRTDALRALIANRLSAWAHHEPDAGACKPAAVGLVIADEGTGAALRGLTGKPRGWSTRAALILTRRAARMNRHAGQWALPGGRMDAGETAEQTVLRELAEEVGLVLDPGVVLGRLDSFVTRSGYAITPVVLWAGAARVLQANPDEVASIHRIPLAELLREDAPMLEPLEGSAHPVLKMPVGRQWIAAPTAALLYQFREVCLQGRATRVWHFEQPRFAWR
ncbi:NUDIX hydrolase [Aquabacterium sp. OR-4]|uniref:NUDIX hydrolase n=1 Tax=Aquabacterium sp. OR-4 TaxID=2978127 RepID=UPI0021B23BFA|nr:CoA pyrophosphatase [Aquabacterium sp. OR-4]MDT7836234.1 CoA pyrophosphatase [Aquabacterium sp. OR-4]